MKRLPWWLEDLAVAWTDDGDPAPREGVQEVMVQAQGRRGLAVAYWVGPAQRVLIGAVEGEPDARVVVSEDLMEDLTARLAEPVWKGEVMGGMDLRAPVQLRGLPDELEQALNGAKAALTVPWWGQALGELADVDHQTGTVTVPDLVEAEIAGRRVAYRLSEPRRRLDWAARGGAVAPDGVRFFAKHESLPADADPVEHITTFLRRVKPGPGGKPARPWESDVDGFAP